jgi:ribonuclease HI
MKAMKTMKANNAMKAMKATSSMTASQAYSAVAEKSGLKAKDVKGVMEGIMALAAEELKKNGSFKLGGALNLKLKKKPAKPARKSAYPWLGVNVAGWGFTASIPGFAHLIDFAGPVVTSPLNPYFAGAKAPTNNTGELSGILMALSWLLAAWEDLIIPFAPVRFEFDSDYAANMARRVWKPRENIALILAVRRLLDRVPAQVPVTWAHVFSHTGNDLNDRADLLAKVGAKGEFRASDAEHYNLLRKGQLGNPWDDPVSGGRHCRG